MGAIRSVDELKKIIAGLKVDNKRIVFTNGCFDLLHVGHARYLAEAKKFGDVLIVGLNSDASVKTNKGDKRPVINEQERAEMLAALKPVDYVVLFDDKTPENLISQLMPDIHVKGGDWKVEDLPEAKIVHGYGGEVKIVKHHGGSTTNIIETILKKAELKF